MMIIAGLLAGVMASAAPRYNIVPTPKHLTEAEGYFRLDNNTALVVEDTAYEEIAADFKDQVKHVSLLNGSKTRIVLRKRPGFGKEAYRLTVTPSEVLIEASEVNGAFYALQTFKQLLPAAIYAQALKKPLKFLAPCCTIDDDRPDGDV